MFELGLGFGQQASGGNGMLAAALNGRGAGFVPPSQRVAPNGPFVGNHK